LSGANLHDCRMHRSRLRRCRLDALRGIDGLRGVVMDWADVMELAPQLAAAAGILVAGEDDD